MSNNSLYTFCRWDYNDMKSEVQELFEHIAYLDNCSVGKTSDFQREIDAMLLNVSKLKSILGFKYLFPRD